MLKMMKQSAGQAVLMVLLVAAIALGLGLSIISQSTTDIRISQQEQESARAFNAAEAGIETALRSLSSVTLGEPQSLEVGEGDINVEYTVTGTEFLEGTFSENASVQVILGGSVNTVTIEWVDKDSGQENPGNCSGVSATSGGTAASILVSVVDDNYEVRRYALNACSLNASNGLTDVATAGAGQYLRSYELAVGANDSLLRVRPLYNSASVRITAVNPLPVQGYVIDSKAQSPTQEAKAIEVTRWEPATASVFDYVLFSGGSIIHQ
jgi:Tfp pilus assembly protein PilX